MVSPLASFFNDLHSHKHRDTHGHSLC